MKDDRNFIGTVTLHFYQNASGQMEVRELSNVKPGVEMQIAEVLALMSAKMRERSSPIIVPGVSH